MADIRIKDLTTEAPTSLTGDFLPIDGGTGTRKLSAYSPTFGGNATVGGTLTVSGNTTLSGNLDVASGISTGTAQLQIGNGRTGSGYAYVDLVGDTTYSDYGFRIIRNNGGANTSSELAHRGTGDFALVANDAAPIKFYTNGVTAATIAATTGNTTIHSTTASTTTSSGALVVGNGTSGGLGVGGAIYAGGVISTTSSSGVAVVGGRQWSIRANSALGSPPSAFVIRDDSLGSERVTIDASGNIAALSTTASTSTSSGALVVSGGVGVAGAIYAGGDLTVDKTEPTITFRRAANTNLNIVNFWTGVAADFGIGLRNTTDSDLHIYNYGTANDALKIAKADSLATFGGAVRTAAPSGGTAANWKLGTVASVSPTSPNRTIEVDIGGTIYYIHAKTTNN